MKYALENNISHMDIDYQKGHLEEIIDTITSKYGVDSSDISHSIIRSKVTRSNNIIVTRMQDGYISPMAKVEDRIVGLIIQMARIRYPLTSSSYLQFANNFISGTQVEERGIKFREKCSFMNDKEGKKLLEYILKREYSSHR